MYDGARDLSDRKTKGREINFRAKCSLEGDTHVGVLRIVRENEFTIRVFVPGFDKKGILYVQCPTLTREDLARPRD